MVKGYTPRETKWIEAHGGRVGVVSAREARERESSYEKRGARGGGEGGGMVGGLPSGVKPHKSLPQGVPEIPPRKKPLPAPLLKALKALDKKSRNYGETYYDSREHAALRKVESPPLDIRTSPSERSSGDRVTQNPFIPSIPSRLKEYTYKDYLKDEALKKTLGISSLKPLTDKAKREVVRTAGGAEAVERGKLQGKPVWRVKLLKTGGELSILGAPPKGAKIIKRGSARRTDHRAREERVIARPSSKDLVRRPLGG